MKLTVPDTDREISLNNVVANHYAENASTLSMKCSDCCPHKGVCPQTGKCKLMEAVSQRTLISTPKFLFIQLWRFSSHQSLKVNTKVIPENLLVLPNEEKFKLVSIVNHLGSQINNGHYLALIKTGAKWIKCDDEKLSKTELKKELSGSNYVFVYEKIDSSEPLPSQLSKVTENEVVDPIGKETKHDAISNQESRRENETVKEGSIFVFVEEGTKIKGINDEKFQCDCCQEVLSYAQTVSHLLNSDCKNKVIVTEFIASWKKFQELK